MTTRRSEAGASVIGEQGSFSTPWSTGFRGQFLQDLTQFIECWGRGPIPYNYHLPLSSAEIQLFAVDVPKYIEDYVEHLTKSSTAQDQGNYAVQRYIGQSDDPYNQFRDSSRTTEFFPAGDMLGSVMPEQLRRDAPGGWPTSVYTGGTTVATASQTFHNHNYEKIFQSTGTTFTRGSDVRDLPYGQTSSRKSASHAPSRTSTDNVDHKAGRSSSACRGNVGKQGRRGFSHAEPSKRATSTTSRRQSEASKARREARPHPCPQCPETFPFEARLKSHMAVHAKAKIPCPECGAFFGRGSSLKRHRNTPGSCEKKKQAKTRLSSRGTSHHGSDGVLIDNNPPNRQNNSGIRPGNNDMARNHTPASPRLAQSLFLTPTPLERGAEQHYPESFPGTSHIQTPQPQFNWQGTTYFDENYLM